MIIVNKFPIIENGYETAFPNFNGTHIFDLSNDDILIYYLKLFENRTSNNKIYIDKYLSIEELEKDIYGECVHINNGNWTIMNFKLIYNSLNKLVFLDKINLLIEKYGNLISTYTISPFCIKSNETINLLDYLKSIYPNIEIETWDDYRS